MRFFFINISLLLHLSAYAETKYFGGNVTMSHKKMNKKFDRQGVLKLTLNKSNEMIFELTYLNEKETPTTVKNMIIENEQGVRFVSYKYNGEPYDVSVKRKVQGEIRKYAFIRKTPETVTKSYMSISNWNRWLVRHKITQVKDPNYIIVMDLDLLSINETAYFDRLKQINKN